MGTSFSSDVRLSGKVCTRADLEVCLDIVRAATPTWCWSHDEFPGVANETVAHAAATFDPSRGIFAARLVTRARSRVSRAIFRSRPAFERQVDLVYLEGVEDRDLQTARVEDPFEVADSTADVTAFLATISPKARAVAALLADGHSQAEAALALGMPARQVSRIVASLRPVASRFFDRPAAA